MQGVLRYFSVKRHKNDLPTGKYNFAKKNIICLAFPSGEGGPLAVEEVLLFLKFFDISVFTFETSIVGYAATFPIGESKFFDNFAKQNIAPVLRDAEASSPTASLQ